MVTRRSRAVFIHSKTTTLTADKRLLLEQKLVFWIHTQMNGVMIDVWWFHSDQTHRVIIIIIIIGVNNGRIQLLPESLCETAFSGPPQTFPLFVYSLRSSSIDVFFEAFGVKNKISVTVARTRRVSGPMNARVTSHDPPWARADDDTQKNQILWTNKSWFIVSIVWEQGFRKTVCGVSAPRTAAASHELWRHVITNIISTLRGDITCY